MRTPEAEPQFNPKAGTLNEIYHPGSWLARLYESRFRIRTNQPDEGLINSLIINGHTIERGRFTMKKGQAVFAEALVLQHEDEYGLVPLGRATPVEIGPLILGQVSSQDFSTRLVSLGRNPMIGFPTMTREGVFEVAATQLAELKNIAKNIYRIETLPLDDQYLVRKLRSIGPKSIMSLVFLAPVVGRPNLLRGYRKTSNT